MFTLLVEVEVRPEALEEFTLAIARNARESVAHEEGCLRFDACQVVDAPTRWVFFEVYADEASWMRHRDTPHFLSYKAVADRALLSRRATALRPIDATRAS